MDIRARLRQAGLRATRPRLLVYETLEEVGGHRSVDELITILERRGQAIPRMTIYNVVSDLANAGIVMCAATGPGCALYEASDTWHHHFVCRVCKTIIDVPCATGVKPCLEPPPSLGGTVDEAQVVFRGVCDKCSIEKGLHGAEG
jgi:Fur family ferric uptake transcriptional regulator